MQIMETREYKNKKKLSLKAKEKKQIIVYKFFTIIKKLRIYNFIFNH